jgi:hypothetical protein
MYQVARIQHQSTMAWPQVFNSYLAAYQFCPSRLEPILYVARYYRETKQYHLGHLFSRLCVETPYPDDILFIEKNIYEYELPLEYGICCYWILFWVERATGLYRPATRRAEWEARPEAMKMGLVQRAAALFRSAGRPESFRERVARATHFPDRLWDRRIGWRACPSPRPSSPLVARGEGEAIHDDKRPAA